MMEAGTVLSVKYPFVRCEVEVFEQDGPATIQSWKPGVEYVPTGPYGESSEAECDGEGAMVLTVVDVHKPGRFPARVFFTRRWVDPDGKEFGKGGLHIMTAQAFKRRANGYMHEYEVRASIQGIGSAGNG